MSGHLMIRYADCHTCCRGDENFHDFLLQTNCTTESIYGFGAHRSWSLLSSGESGKVEIWRGDPPPPGQQLASDPERNSYRRTISCGVRIALHVTKESNARLPLWSYWRQQRELSVTKKGVLVTNVGILSRLRRLVK